MFSWRAESKRGGREGLRKWGWWSPRKDISDCPSEQTEGRTSSASSLVLQEQTRKCGGLHTLSQSPLRPIWFMVSSIRRLKVKAESGFQTPDVWLSLCLGLDLSWEWSTKFSFTDLITYWRMNICIHYMWASIWSDSKVLEKRFGCYVLLWSVMSDSFNSCQIPPSWVKSCWLWLWPFSGQTGHLAIIEAVHKILIFIGSSELLLSSLWLTAPSTCQIQAAFSVNGPRADTHLVCIRYFNTSVSSTNEWMNTFLNLLVSANKAP